MKYIVKLENILFMGPCIAPNRSNSRFLRLKSKQTYSMTLSISSSLLLIFLSYLFPSPIVVFVYTLNTKIKIIRLFKINIYFY